MNNMDKSTRPRLSVVLITLNEESGLRACLNSLPELSEIIILDSGSQDQTLEIAKAFNARIYSRPFDDFASQKNAAIEKASGHWILSLDADEILSESLAEKIKEISESDEVSECGFTIERRLVFLGRRMRFGKSRDFPLRFFKRGTGSFKHKIHEILQVDGKIGRLKGMMDHYSYRDLSDYFSRFNRYTSQVALNHYRQGKRGSKGLFFLLRPFIEFLNRYILRLGFLDGYPGYCYALVSSLYAFIKYAKLIELHDRENPNIEG